MSAETGSIVSESPMLADPAPTLSSPDSIREFLGHLTPAGVINLAYCYYVAEQAGQNGHDSPITLLSRKVIETFEYLYSSVERLSAEGAFLDEINKSVVSLSRGLFRRKQTLHLAQAEAEEEKRDQLRVISNANTRSAIFGGIIRSVLLGGVAFFLARVFVPEVVENANHGTTNFSLAVGIGVSLFSGYLKLTLNSWRMLHVMAVYGQAKKFAADEYQHGSQEEYDRAREEVRQAWLAYFQHEPPETIDFGHVMEEDMRLREFHLEERHKLLLGPRYVFYKLFMSMSNKFRFKSAVTDKAAA